jgi:xylulokinase
VGSPAASWKGILVYDIGTTSVKSAVFDSEGKPRFSVSAPYKTEYPRPGWAEQDPAQFWEAAVAGTKKMFALPEAAGLSIEAIGLSGHMNGSLPVDGEGNPVYPELIHSDSRSGVQCEKILSQFGTEELYAVTGNRTDVHLSLPKMLWLKDQEPEAYKRTRWFLNSKDFLRLKLTGISGVSDYSDASLTGVFNVKERAWAWDLIDGLGFSRSCFPEVRSSIENGGKLSKEAAAALGLPSGIPVSVGGGDGSCATRGSGISVQGEAYISFGSSAWISVLAPNPVFDPKKRMQNFFDLDGKNCNICGTVQSAGAAVDWVLGLLFGDAELPSEEYRRIEKELMSIPIGSGGVMFLPYLMGERTPHWDPAARGVFSGLSLSSGRENMIRSVYEGVSFALREVTEVYTDLAMKVTSMKLLGGGVRSVFWQKMICDILGMPVFIHPFPTHAISLGAAMAAGVSTGMWRDLDEACRVVSAGAERIMPDPVKTEAYEPLFAKYKNMYSALKPVFNELQNTSDLS